MKEHSDGHSGATVMVVDDEAMVTRAIASLLELESEYRVVEFASPTRALEFARRDRVDCVVTDFLMPDMDGLTFLLALRGFAPDVPAILLTGYADKGSAIRAINEVDLYSYLEKPWDNDRLHLIIRKAIEHRSLQQAMAERVRELDLALRARDTLQRSAEELEAELVLAEEVQRSILPQGPLEDSRFKFSHRYYPTGRLGGDFFDVAITSPGYFNAIVADVSGHGVAAALGTMMVKVIFMESSRRKECCDGMLNDMNERLCLLLSRTQYVTAFALSINADEQEITAAPAGGPHPILFSRDPDRLVEEWVLNGLPLGAFDATIYRHPEIQTRRFAPGDRILLYTDGLLDTDVLEGESADSKEIVRLVEDMRDFDGEDLLDRIAEARGVGRGPLPDDVNLLLIDFL